MSQCHCSHRGAPPRDRCIDSLCVNCGLCVKGRAKVGSLTIGCTGNWTICENASGNLEFAYRGQPRLTLNKNSNSVTVDKLNARCVTADQIIVMDQEIWLGPPNEVNSFMLAPDPNRGQDATPENALLFQVVTGVETYNEIGTLASYTTSYVPVSIGP